MEEKKYHPTTLNELKELCNDESVYLGDIDTSKIEVMSSLFMDSNRKDFSGIETWDTSNVSRMENMFRNAKYFNHDISNWNIDNVEYAYSMFEDSNFHRLIPEKLAICAGMCRYGHDKAELSMTQEGIDLLRKDFGLPKKIDIRQILVDECHVNLNDWNDNTISVGEIFNDKDVLSLSLSNKELNDIITVDGKNLSTVEKSKDSNIHDALARFNKTVLSIYDYNTWDGVYLLNFSRLFPDKVNIIVDEQLDKFYSALENYNVSDMSDSLKNLTSITTVYNMLEEKWAEEYGVYICNRKIRENSYLQMSISRPFLRSETLATAMDDDLKNLDEKLRKLQGSLIDEKEIKKTLLEGNQDKIIDYINLRLPKQQEIVKEIQLVMKQANQSIDKYVSQDRSGYSQNRDAILARYKKVKKSQEQTMEHNLGSR